MRLSAVEVLQTSAMDCGPAALASLLAGMGRPINLGVLREACQTDLDGTSIDVLEQVAMEHGLMAMQQMLPADRLTRNLPALVVVRLPDGAPHFVTIWRSLGPLVQVMDPARGSYWTRASRFLPTLLQHSIAIPCEDWCLWARSDENLSALRHMARTLGLPAKVVTAAAAETGWFPLAALEAAMRLTLALPKPSPALTHALLAETKASEADIFCLIPQEFWPVIPDPKATRADPSLLLQGAVLLTVKGPPETNKAPKPKPKSLLIPLFFQGRLPVMLLIGTIIIVLGTLFEALAFRSLIEPGGSLPVTIALVACLYLARLSLGSGVLALGRRVESRMRRSITEKILRLPDRWIASRSLGDLAERAQSLHSVRALPGLSLHIVQAVTEAVALSVGLILIAPDAAVGVMAICALALAWPFALPPLLRDRELSLRSLGAAQAAVLMDALQGQAALQAHRGQDALTARHRSLLQDWQAAARDRSILAGSALALGQAMVFCLTALVILQRPTLDILFLWWLMKLPSSAAELSSLLRQIPAQEAILTRALEPVNTPDRPIAALPPDLAVAPALGIKLQDVHVVAAGHPVLQGINLSIAPGAAVAIVGASGSGKSSLLGLMLGWHDLIQGSMTVNNHSLTVAQRNALTDRIAWVDPTVRLWGVALDDTSGNPALVDLHLRGDTVIGAGGAALSAGEGQRLRLSRALAHPDPALVLCDEALRGLDAPRRKELLRTVRDRWVGRTLVWVTHDIEEAMGFDHVLVMESGQIAEEGAPRELMARNGAFASLWRSQQAMVDRMARDWKAIPVESFQRVPDVQSAA